MDMNNNSDFSKGSIYKHIMVLALPLTLAQIVQMLYNIVDRIYIGHLPENSQLALGGVGITFPIITIILAFTNLFGMGGSPLFSIARGKKKDDEAKKIMGNTFVMLVITSLILMAVCYLFLKPVLYLFGASDNTYYYAAQYMKIYLLGTPFTMLATGMNGFINAQGKGATGMMTVAIGAILNIILDSLFMLGFGMGVEGAAIATVISQVISCSWVLIFFRSKHTLYRLEKDCMAIDLKLVKRIMALGTAGFVMSASNGLVQIACNMTLQNIGGDIYVSIMTVLNSLRDMVLLPVHGVTSAAQPVMGFNYGARQYDRIKQSIRFITVIGFIYIFTIWLILRIFPEFFIQIFNSDPELVAKAVPSMHIFLWGLFMMTFQLCGQATFTSLGLSKQAIFFSIFRKVIIVVPLTFLLPQFVGVNGVFLAEPISNFIGGAACYCTMLYVTRSIFSDTIRN